MLFLENVENSANKFQTIIFGCKIESVIKKYFYDFCSDEINRFEVKAIKLFILAKMSILDHL